jgi:hypothetical protein
MWNWITTGLSKLFNGSSDDDLLYKNDPVFDVKFEDTGVESLNNMYHHIHMTFGFKKAQMKFRIDIHKYHIDEAIIQLYKFRDSLWSLSYNYEDTVDFVGNSKFFFSPAFTVSTTINSNDKYFKISPVLLNRNSNIGFELYLEFDQIVSLEHHLDIISSQLDKLRNQSIGESVKAKSFTMTVLTQSDIEDSDVDKMQEKMCGCVGDGPCSYCHFCGEKYHDGNCHTDDKYITPKKQIMKTFGYGSPHFNSSS